MTRIYQLDLTKKKLAAMLPDERRLLLLLGHAANEINVLQKLNVVALLPTLELKFVDHAQTGQAFVLMRSLIGKLHEAWELFRKRFLGVREINAKYLPKLDTKAKTALENLKKHFGKKSPLTLVRNGFSFHYCDDKDLVENSFQEIPDDNPWCFYLSDVAGNCFYYASELVVEAGVIKLANLSHSSTESYLEQTGRALKELCDLIINVSDQIMTLFHDCIDKIVRENLSNAKLSDSIEIVDAPSLLSIRIPFFIDDTEFHPKADSRPPQEI